jgi:hypothetical protein
MTPTAQTAVEGASPLNIASMSAASAPLLQSTETKYLICTPVQAPAGIVSANKA